MDFCSLGGAVLFYAGVAVAVNDDWRRENQRVN